MIASLIEFITPMNYNACLAEYHAKNLITFKIKLRGYAYFHLATTGLLINEYEVSNRHGAKVIIKSISVPWVDKTKRPPY